MSNLRIEPQWIAAGAALLALYIALDQVMALRPLRRGAAL